MTRRDDEQANDRKNEPSFKFVDRRRFDESGESRGIEEAVDETKPQAIPVSAQAEVPPTHADSKAEVDAPSEDEDPASGPVTFSLFLQSLAQQTLMAMGVIPWPDTGLVRVNLDHARETIEILTILHEKTKGNLTDGESKALTSLLNDLRQTYAAALAPPGQN